MGDTYFLYCVLAAYIPTAPNLVYRSAAASSTPVCTRLSMADRISASAFHPDAEDFVPRTQCGPDIANVGEVGAPFFAHIGEQAVEKIVGVEVKDEDADEVLASISGYVEVPTGTEAKDDEAQDQGHLHSADALLEGWGMASFPPRKIVLRPAPAGRGRLGGSVDDRLHGRCVQRRPGTYGFPLIRKHTMVEVSARRFCPFRNGRILHRLMMLSAHRGSAVLPQRSSKSRKVRGSAPTAGLPKKEEATMLVRHLKPSLRNLSASIFRRFAGCWCCSSSSWYRMRFLPHLQR